MSDIKISIDSNKSTSKSWALCVEIPQGMDIDNANAKNLLEKIVLNPLHKNGLFKVSPGSITTNYIQVGPAGPMSSSGCLPYPAGNWAANVLYEMGSNSVPYVYYNNDYYLLNVPSSKKGSWVEKDWIKFEKFEALQTEFMLAQNADFGSSVGSKFYDNYMFSQQGLDENSNLCHYSHIMTNNISAFDTITDGSITYSKLNDNFKPNLSFDFYNGEISCNKLCEQYDYFNLLDIQDYESKYVNGSYPIYINTFFINPNKSHNICITSRYMPVTWGDEKSLRRVECIARPGVVVLPKYDKTVANDGIRMCINYPISPFYGYDNTKERDKWGKMIYPPIATGECSYNRYYNTYALTHNYESESLSINKTSSGFTNIDGYVLLCADPDIFDSSKYINGKFTGEPDSNCFIWNGFKCKFILMCSGSEALLRSVLLKHRCSTTAIYDGLTGKMFETDICEGYNSIKTLKFKYSIEADVFNADAPDIHIVEKNIGIQWIIENTNSFNPVPMKIQIDNFNPDNFSNGNIDLCTFKCGLPGYLNTSEFICLCTGTIDYDYDTNTKYFDYVIKVPDPNGKWQGTRPPEDIEIPYLDVDNNTGILKNLKKPLFYYDGVNYNFETREWENLPIVRLNINDSVNSYQHNNDKIHASTCIQNSEWTYWYDKHILYEP